MNSRLTQHLIAASLLALAGSVGAQEAEKPVAVNVEGMPAHLSARLQEKAKQGPTAVIQYINRTRHIHNLRADAVIKPEEASNVARAGKDETLVAERTDAPRK
jgi:hypothetical protein